MTAYPRRDPADLMFAPYVGMLALVFLAAVAGWLNLPV